MGYNEIGSITREEMNRRKKEAYLKKRREEYKRKHTEEINEKEYNLFMRNVFHVRPKIIKKHAQIKRCAACGQVVHMNKASYHHIIPRKYGGIDDDVNRIPLCHKCHDDIEIKTEFYIEKYHHYDIETLKHMIIHDGLEVI